MGLSHELETSIDRYENDQYDPSQGLPGAPRSPRGWSHLQHFERLIAAAQTGALQRRAGLLASWQDFSE